MFVPGGSGRLLGGFWGLWKAPPGELVAILKYVIKALFFAPGGSGRLLGGEFEDSTAHGAKEKLRNS